MDVVPRVMVAGSGEQGSNGNVMEALLTMLLSDRFGAMQNDPMQSKRSPEVEALREQIRKDMEKKKE